MNPVETSIIIRTRNEQRWIGRVLERLASQTYSNFEIIIVDSGSTDNTLSIVSTFADRVGEKHWVKVVHIKPEEFSYPHALNIGIQASQATKYIAILSAHSLPVSAKWLESGVGYIDKHEKISGVYGPLKALPDGTFWDKVIHNFWYIKEMFACFPKSYRIVGREDVGVLGFTNALIRRELWDQYHFNEAFGNGGEDGDWAKYWFNKGYAVVKDMGFAVRHSHYLNFSQWTEQLRYWQSLGAPQVFRRLSYRKDGAHREDISAPSFTFGDTPEQADQLLALVIEGRKTATSWAAVHGDFGSRVGQRQIIKDSRGVDRVVIEITELSKKLFQEVDKTFARDEGEGDLTLDYWRKEHEMYFRAENTFSEDMEVYCLRFNVVNVL
jgi:rhamnosyltransferase